MVPEPYTDNQELARSILAHKDMHFINSMCDLTGPSGRITPVLDWGFSRVLPAPRWNPPRTFLKNAQNNDSAYVEQDAMETDFEEKCKTEGVEHLLQGVKLNELQEPMQTLTDFPRAIVEVYPRG